MQFLYFGYTDFWHSNTYLFIASIIGFKIVPISLYFAF